MMPPATPLACRLHRAPLKCRIVPPNPTEKMSLVFAPHTPWRARTGGDGSGIHGFAVVVVHAGGVAIVRAGGRTTSSVLTSPPPPIPGHTATASGGSRLWKTPKP